MSQDHQCRREGCSLASKHFRLINGAPYCDVHYRQVLVERLHAAYERWTLKGELDPGDWKVISRTFAEFHGISGGSYLSLARIRDRAYDRRRIDGGFEFKITRHLNAFTDPGNMKPVVETWQADNASLVLTLVETRDWRPGDPDPQFSIRAS